MKKLIVTIVTLLLSINPAELSAQSLIHRLGKAIESEVKKEVKKAVNNQKKNTPPAKKQPQKKGEPKNSNIPFAPAEIQPQQFSGNPVPYDPAAPATGKHLGHEWVDLGLPSGTKWATHNLGARYPEMNGEHFEWGETTDILDTKSPKNDLDNNPNASSIAGDPVTDAATSKWGKGWRTPGKEEFQELIDHCQWEWVTLCGRSGYKVTSKTNGQWIFLPAAGTFTGALLYEWPSGTDTSGAYWTSTPVTGRTSYDSYNINFDHRDSGINISSGSRNNGFSIRPVTSGTAH